MSVDRAFVGRADELKQFAQVLRSPRGQAVLIVGQQGMGKTLLANRMAGAAENHPDFLCSSDRFEVTQTDSPAQVMELMLDRAFDAAGLEEGSFEKTERRTSQRFALLKLLPKGDVLGDLIKSLRRDPKKNAREQLLEKLGLVSSRMADNARAIFVIDPEKYMAPGSADAWRIVAGNLPDKIKFLFAQRPEDVLAASAEFKSLDNVLTIPEGALDALDAQEVEDLIQARDAEIAQPIMDVRAAVERYEGHPYAVAAALDLLADGAAISDLPADPTPGRIAEAQWGRVCDAHGEDAVKLFEAYAILEVGVPNEVVAAVSGLDSATRKSLLANRFLLGLIRTEGQGSRLYHSLFGDHVRDQVSEDEAEAYHQRAVDVYRQRLGADVRPDRLAAERLSEHVLAVEGEEAFVLALVNVCTEPLLLLGLFESLEALSHRALDMVEDGGVEEATITGNLGLIFRTRGDLDQAEAMHRRSLEIEEKLGRLEGMASDYGNLGLIFETRGDLDQAEAMHRKALEINEKLGRLEGMASQYGNLGLIFRTRGDLDQAEAMHRKALEINEKLGRLEGMASDYGNLGLIFKTRGDLDQAEAMHRKALEINEKLGRLEGMANQYGNLGLIFRTRGDLDQAEAMHRKSLEIEEKLGRLEGMANQYGNLGLIFETRGEAETAREYWGMAVELYTQIGMPHMVEKVQGWIDGLGGE